MQWRAKSISVLLLCALASVWTLWTQIATASAEPPRAAKLVIWYDTITGTLQGTVLDPAGNGIPLVSVSATNLDTGNVRSKLTDANGFYAIPYLPLGRYEVRAFKEGFVVVTETQNPVKVQLNRVITTIPPIVLGPRPLVTTLPPAPTPALTPTPTPVVAEAAGQLTNHLDAARRSNADENQLLGLPLPEGRTFDVLATLSAGVAPPPQVQGVAGPGIGAGIGTAGQFAVNGQRARANNFTVDGSDNNDEDVGVRRQGFTALVPQTIESVKEVQIVTHLWDAEAGRSSGSQVNAVSRSGANGVHGTLYDFFNHNALNARNFFDDPATSPQEYALTATRIDRFENGTPVNPRSVPVFLREGATGIPRAITQANPAQGKDQFQRNLGGGVLGFPLRPGKTFFFGSFEHQDVKARQETHFAVPTVAQRGFLNFGVTGFTVTEGGRQVAFNPTFTAGDAVFSLFPFPNHPLGPYGENTYTQVLPASASAAILSAKVDHSFKAFGYEHTATARYNFTNDERNVPAVGGALFSGLIPRVGTQNVSLFLNSQLGNSLANQWRASFGRTRLRFDERRDSYLQASQYSPQEPYLLNAGLLGNFGSGNTPGLFLRSTRKVDDHLGTVGQVTIVPFSPVGLDVYLFPQARANNTIQVADGLNYTNKAHTFKFGFDVRRTQLNSFLNRNYRPQFIFSGAPDLTSLFPQVPVSNPSRFGPTPGFFSGTDLAALGISSNITQALTLGTPDSTIGLRFWQLNFYFNDNWRARPGLTLDYGLRYELNTVPREVNSRIKRAFALDQLPPNDPNLRIAAPFTDASTIYDAQRLLTALNNTLAAFRRILGGREEIYEGDHNNLAPRLGLAWDPFARSRTQAGKTVVRAGFGAYYDLNLGSVVSQSRNVFPAFVPFNVDANTFVYAQSRFFIPEAGGTQAIFNPVFVPVDVVSGNRFTRYPLVTASRLNAIDLPSGVLQQALGLLLDPSATGGRPSGGGLAFTLPDKNLRSPYSLQYNLQVERELFKDFLLNVAYVGTKGNKLTRFRTPNGGPNSTTMPIDPLGLTPVPILAIALPPLGNPTAPRPTRPVAELGAYTLFDSSASSSYHSLQASVTKRYTRGYQFTAAYTLGHAIDDVSDVFDMAGAFVLPQDDRNLRAEQASANFDVRQRLVWSLVADVPGLRRFNQTQGTAGFLLGNWQVAALTAYQTGQPFTVNTGYDINLDGNLTDRLDKLTGLQVLNERQQRLALTANPVTLVAALGQNGRIGRNTFRGAGVMKTDLALSKHFKVRKEQTLSLRFEAFNLFNRAHFALPVRILEAPGFGRSTETLFNARQIQFALKFVF